MKSRAVAEGYLVRLERGEEAITSLTAFASENDIPCAVIQGIGAIRDIELGYFDTRTNEYQRQKYNGTFEVVSLSGNISHLDNRPFVHAHVIVAGPDQHVLGGHFFGGTVAVTLEVFIHVIQERLIRTRDPAMGFNFWDLS